MPAATTSRLHPPQPNLSPSLSFLRVPVRAAQVYTTEQLYEQLRPRLATSDAWMAKNHPQLWAAADAMVESLQKKECYGGGVTQVGRWRWWCGLAAAGM